MKVEKCRSVSTKENENEIKIHLHTLCPLSLFIDDKGREGRKSCEKKFVTNLWQFVNSKERFHQDEWLRNGWNFNPKKEQKEVTWKFSPSGQYTIEITGMAMYVTKKGKQLFDLEFQIELLPSAVNRLTFSPSCLGTYISLSLSRTRAFRCSLHCATCWLYIVTGQLKPWSF